MTEPAGRGHGWLLGRVRGIPVYLGRSWPVVAAVVVVTFGPSARIPGWPAWSGYAVALGYAVVLLLSVFAHEAGHAVAARSQGLPVTRVAADLWGGHTAYDASSARPGTSALVAIAGPAANLALAGAGWLVAQLDTGAFVGAVVGSMVAANLLVTAFNLLPGLPLDGGFLLEALVWRVTGNRADGMVAAGWVGRLVAVGGLVLLVVVPLLSARSPSFVALVWGAFVAGFLWVGATQAIRVGGTRRRLETRPLASLLQPVVLLPAHSSARTLRHLAATPSDWQGRPPVPVLVGPDGQPAGYLSTDAVHTVPEDALDTVAASSFLVRPEPGWIVGGDPTASAWPVVQVLAGRGAGPLVQDTVLVVDHGTHRPAGVVTLAALTAAADSPADPGHRPAPGSRQA